MSNISSTPAKSPPPPIGVPAQHVPPAVSVPATVSAPQSAKTDNTVEPGGAKDATRTSSPVEKTRFFKKKKVKPPSYAHDVYKRRFKHFRTLRLLSLLVGGSILLVLVLGMWRLHTMVFSTIEDTEHLFLITEKRRTHTIEFNELEKVRESWNSKYSASTTLFTKSLFPLPAPEEPPSEEEVE